MKKVLLFFTMLMVSSMLAFGQQTTVSGKVVGEDGSPIPFASVQIKGTSTGTTTNENGNFSLSVPANATLHISYVGFTSKDVEVGDHSTLNIILASNTKQLNELVVTALGLERTRNSLPYAAQQISGDAVNKTVTTNVVDNLSGKISGLQITTSNAMGGSDNVILRGMKSLTQSNQALFVIDGVPYSNSSTTGYGYDFGSVLSDINPDDIASISVLKGAAASALYGSRASNGVILITTKKGASNKAVGVTASFGISAGSFDNTTLPTYQTMYGEGYDPDFQQTPIFNSNGANEPVVETYADAATGVKYDPSQMVYQWDAFAPGDPNYGKATPWEPAAHHNPTDYFVTPITTTENVAIEGGGDNGSFRMGYTRDDDKGYMPNSNIRKNLFNIDATYNVTNRITVEGSLDYTTENALNRYLYEYTATTNPMTDFRQWWPTGVDIQQQKADYFKTLLNDTWNWQSNAYDYNTINGIGLPAYHNNLYFNQYQDYENDSRERYFGFAKVNYKITNYLSLMGRVATDYYNLMIETRHNIGSVEPSDYTRYNETYQETNYDLLLNFNKNFGKNFNVKALLGTNVRQDNIQSITTGTNGGLVIPGLWALSNSVNTVGAPSESYELKEVDGVFAEATLSYKDMITLDGTIRRDQSSTLPKANDSYYYPSVSANFVFSKLLPSAHWLSYGKIWGNYAQVGGDAPYYSLQNTYSLNTPFNGQSIASAPTTNNNANLVPEENNTYEVGLESAFINNRLGFTVDYYNSKQINEIMPTSVSTASGFGTFYVNGGEVQNQGVELTLNASPIRTRTFSWDMTVNWSTNQNKVLSLYGGQPSYVIAGLQNAIQIVAEVGKPYGIIRGTDYVYNSSGQKVTSNGYYEFASNPLSDIGTINPRWFGSISNSFTYKSFSLSFLIDAKEGGDVYSLDMDYGSLSGLYPRTAGYNDLGNPVRNPLSQGGGLILKGVDASTGKPNTIRVDESNIDAGAWTFSSAEDEPAKTFVYDASYIKLREVAFTYALPQKTMERIKFAKSIDLSLSGRNLWIIHKNLPYADPEQGQASGNASMGFQNGAYPTIRTINFIVRAKF